MSSEATNGYQMNSDDGSNTLTESSAGTISNDQKQKNQ